MDIKKESRDRLKSTDDQSNPASRRNHTEEKKTTDDKKIDKLVQIESTDEIEKKIWGKYYFKKIIGKGGFSIVISLHEKANGNIIAAKVIEKHKVKPNTLHLLREEPSILKITCHPNIIKMSQFVESKKRMFLLLEYMEGGDLSRYIKSRKRDMKPFTEPEVVNVIYKILSAISYLHINNIVHRDIKPGRVMSKI